jgi:hypothetical protein
MADANRRLTERELTRLRGSAFGALVMLIVQVALGIVVNLYVTVPAKEKGSGFFGAIGWALGKSPAALASHAGLAILLVIAAAFLVVRAILARHTLTIVLAVVGFLSIISAAVNGERFVSTGGPDYASLAMALAAAGAMLCYAIILFALGNPRSRP